MSNASRTPSPSPNRSAKTSLASSTRSDLDIPPTTSAVSGPISSSSDANKPSTSSFTKGIGRFFRNSVKRNSPRSARMFSEPPTTSDSVESARSEDIIQRSPTPSRPCSPTPSREKSPQRSRSKRLAGFASRSIRKSQWRLFKHRTFFGSQQRNSIKKNELQLPKLTLRHPSVDSAAMPLPIDVDDINMRDFLQIRRGSRWTAESESSGGRLRDSRDSSDFNDSHDTLDVVATAPIGGAGGGSATTATTSGDHHQSMTAPVSPSVPLSASSSHSEGWKYSSQKLLWKLKPRYINFSHASSTSSSTDSAWKSLDSMTWRSVDGAEVVLRGARLENLSEIERSALHLLALQRLARLLPGVNLGKPKVLRQKRQKLVKSNRAPTMSDVQRRASGVPEENRVFGVSLAMCMMNEKRLDQESRCRSLDDSTVVLMNRKPVAKSVKSEPEIINHPTNDDRKWLYPSTQNLYPTSSSNPSSPSPISIMPATNHLLSAEPEVPQVTGRFAKKTRPTSASFSCSLDASTTDDVDPHALQVPKIVENCTQYLMAYGLNQVGLFRVAGNTKRCRQLRNALEKAGGGTAINDNMVANTTAHDVATLLKEYFRDLPQSLLPKEHYQAYIAAARLSIEDRIEAIRLLFALLVSPNLDTLFVLLKFLSEVSMNSNDRTGADGETIQGNKMDAHNLATIFAPSILRADHDKLQESLAENEQQITIVETMITNVEEIFKIPKELQCKIYTQLRETEPDRLDRILNHLSKMDSLERQSLLSPFPATVEEDGTVSPRAHHRHSDHSHIGRQSPLARELTGNGRVKVQSQRSGSWPYSLTKTQTSPNRPEATQRFFPSDEPPNSKSASATPSTSRRADRAADDSGRDSEFCSDEIPAARGEAPRSPSRERVDTLRTAARSGAAAARRRLRNVVRAFRLSSVARSSPDIVS
ncbi:unnamed protein product [Caenorhabditis bovis]|uniref:Rho-GAP domain-containing protein n=1 Tax=Caenorhabditis bovis TaxID=2654633 RepID=A0A8S1EUS5_9PELO|nr:unnamed protein product [Caenorhabditis bovis]